VDLKRLNMSSGEVVVEAIRPSKIQQSNMIKDFDRSLFR